MTASEGIALLVAVLGLAGTFQQFVAVPLLWKVCALLVAGAGLAWILARRLSSWSAAEPKMGFGDGRLLRRGWTRFATVVGLFLVSLGFAGGTMLVVWFYAINIFETRNQSDQLVVWIHGSLVPADVIEVLPPPYPEARCAPVDASGEASLRAATVMSGWESPTPQLKLTSFSYPQRQGIVCRREITIGRFDVRAEPRHVDVLLPGRRLTYFLGIAVIWGILWIAFSIYAIARSR